MAPRSKSLPPYNPQLAQLVKEPPAGDGWIHEIKPDGYQAALWSGEHTRNLTQASTAYLQSLRATSEWHVLTAIDVSTFLSYLHEEARGERKLAEYIRTGLDPIRWTG